MRIALITATFPPYKGGTGNVCFHNAVELVHHGHDVHVFTARVAGTVADEIQQGITIHRLIPFFRIGNAPLLPQLMIRLGGFDIIHLHYPFFGGEVAALTAKLTNTPLIITYHQDVILTGLMGGIEKIIRMSIGRATLRSARKLLFTSSDYAQESYARDLLKGREDIIGVLPNGVDVQTFSPGKPLEVLSERYHIGFNDRVVLLVAGLDRAHYFKGVHILLEALTQLPSYIKGLIVGDGDLRAYYEQLAAELGISERVSFAGRVADGTLQDYYRLANVTVLPSVTMGEAFGLVLLESMACGIPVIASSLPGVRTVIANHEDGILVKPADSNELAIAVQSLVDDPERCVRMGQAGRQKVVEKNAWPQNGDALEAIYENILMRNGVY